MTGEGESTQPARFTAIRHVHCRQCFRAIDVVDGQDENGYYVGTIADHECSLGDLLRGGL